MDHGLIALISVGVSMFTMVAIVMAISRWQERKRRVHR